MHIIVMRTLKKIIKDGYIESSAYKRECLLTCSLMLKGPGLRVKVNFLEVKGRWIWKMVVGRMYSNSFPIGMTTIWTIKEEMKMAGARELKKTLTPVKRVEATMPMNQERKVLTGREGSSVAETAARTSG